MSWCEICPPFVARLCCCLCFEFAHTNNSYTSERTNNAGTQFSMHCRIHAAYKWTIETVAMAEAQGLRASGLGPRERALILLMEAMKHLKNQYQRGVTKYRNTAACLLLAA